MALKERDFQRAQSRLQAGAILASNTSSLTSTKLPPPLRARIRNRHALLSRHVYASAGNSAGAAPVGSNRHVHALSRNGQGRRAGRQLHGLCRQPHVRALPVASAVSCGRRGRVSKRSTTLSTNFRHAMALSPPATSPASMWAGHPQENPHLQKAGLRKAFIGGIVSANWALRQKTGAAGTNTTKIASHL